MNAKESLVIQGLSTDLVRMEKNLKALSDENIELTKTIKAFMCKKQEPINLEHNIIDTSIKAINAAIEKCLIGYDSPLMRLIKIVIDKHSLELCEIIEACLKNVTTKESFKNSIIDAFSHKLARNIISMNESLTDKVSSDLMKNPAFKAKAILALDNIITEFVVNKDNDSI